VQNFYSFFLISFSALFTIINPLGAVPAFLVMSAEDSLAKRLVMARRASIVSFVVLAGCAALGGFLFEFFGFTLPALKIAGGILLFFIAFDMINARQSRARATDEEAKEGFIKDDIAVFPLAIPLLSGPGAIVTVLLLAERAKNPVQHVALYISLAISMIISALILGQAGRLSKYMGRIGLNVFSRLMGLILAAIAVQFVLDGVIEALPGLVAGGAQSPH
jgi:multiple antibiotic resistance protein